MRHSVSSVYFNMYVYRSLNSNINLWRISRLRRYTKCYGGGPIFRVWIEILLLGKALKFGLIFQNYTIKINKTLKNYWENSSKMQIFHSVFNFPSGHNFIIMGKIRNIIWTCHYVGSAAGTRSPPPARRS